MKKVIDSHLADEEYDRKGRMIGKQEQAYLIAVIIFGFVVGGVLYVLHMLFAFGALACRKGLEAMERKVEDARKSADDIRSDDDGPRDDEWLRTRGVVTGVHRERDAS